MASIFELMDRTGPSTTTSTSGLLVGTGEPIGVFSASVGDGEGKLVTEVGRSVIEGELDGVVT